MPKKGVLDRFQGELGSLIRLCRAGQGLTQRELARKLRVSERYLSMIENGCRLPSKDLLEKMGKFLKVTPMRLLKKAIPRGLIFEMILGLLHRRRKD